MRTLSVQYQAALEDDDGKKLDQTWQRLSSQFRKHVQMTNTPAPILRGLVPVIEQTKQGKFVGVVDSTKHNQPKLQDFQEIASVPGSECRHCVTALSD